jgi:nuclear cap-binding protein subunit 1
MLALLKKKATEDEIQPVIEQIETQARTLALPEPILASTDPYVTAICYVGSKSLSHLLLTVERCRERLLNIGNASESARRQIIRSVMAYWHDQPGIGVNIVDKLLNFAILTPESVIEWCLVDDSGAGDKLSETHVYEMVANTVQKVTNRLHQIVSQRNAPGLEHEQKLALDETLLAERVKMQELFQRMEEILVGWASGSKDQAIEAGLAVTEDEKLIRQWGERWLRVFRRKMAAEEAFLIESGNRQVQQDGAEVVNGNDMDVEV